MVHCSTSATGQHMLCTRNLSLFERKPALSRTLSYNARSYEGLDLGHDVSCHGDRILLYTSIYGYARNKGELERSSSGKSRDYMVRYTYAHDGILQKALGRTVQCCKHKCLLYLLVFVEVFRRVCGYQLNSKPVWECTQVLEKVAFGNTVMLSWSPDTEGLRATKKRHVGQRGGPVSSLWLRTRPGRNASSCHSLSACLPSA